MTERVTVWQGLRNLWGVMLRAWPSARLMLAVALLAVIGQAAADYARGLTSVVVVENGHARQIRTRCSTVGELLQDLGIELGPQDRLSPAEDVVLEPRVRIDVLHARPVYLTIDGVTQVVQAHGLSAEEILAEAGVELRPGDELRVNGALLSEPAQAEGGGLHVRAASLAGIGRDARMVVGSAAVSHVEILRAARVRLLDGRTEQTLYSTASTVGQALLEANALLYEGDQVEPGLDVPLADGLEVRIYRAKPVEVYVDGRVLRTRTQSGRVNEVLAELSLSLVGRDFCDPPLDASIADGAQLRITRVTERSPVVGTSAR